MSGDSRFAEALEELNRVTGLKLSVESEDEEAAEKLQMLAAAYRDRFDKNGFIRKLMSGGVEEAELYSSAARFHIADRQRRIVYVVELDERHGEDAARVMKSLFVTKTGDLFAELGERRLALIKTVQPKDTADTADNLAHTIVDMLNTEVMIPAHVGYGAVSESLSTIPQACREAMLALEIGRVFDLSETVYRYDRLGVGRLVHDLPRESAELFLKEVFGSRTPKDLDAETVEIVNAFFDNNLNLSETARQLYIHRNTLVYRLEKLNALIGLDLRNFDDALRLKLAMMIADSLKAKNDRGI
ncbi:MAG: helix-turn-helix domain-containing protein [Lachnospiraceae bacterium]|nr:helix-turn-helix domain-containing protein [Lachnospiraceae bacterium]